MTGRDHRHFPRIDGSLCPDPDRCEHTTAFEGEVCECCGRTQQREHVDVCRSRRGEACNCVAGLPED